MLDELVDQHWVLPEVQMDVAGQQVRRHETCVADHVALGVLHLVSGLQVAVVSGDAAPMELVPTVELTPRREDAVFEREELAVPEAMDLTIHLDIDGDHAGHTLDRPRVGAERASGTSVPRTPHRSVCR